MKFNVYDVHKLSNEVKRYDAKAEFDAKADSGFVCSFDMHSKIIDDVKSVNILMHKKADGNVLDFENEIGKNEMGDGEFIIINTIVLHKENDQIIFSNHGLLYSFNKNNKFNYEIDDNVDILLFFKR